jgi:uncharacterized repeat protein (TIGR03803 family)
MKRIVSASGKLDLGKRTCAVFVLCAAPAIVLPAQTFTTLSSFDGTNGAWPGAPLAQATNGRLYGTTQEGGAHNDGTVFEISPGGTLKTVYSFFCSLNGCADGAMPSAGLVQAINGGFYGTTAAAAGSGYGTIFKVTASGALTTLYTFCSQSDCPDGAAPYAGLVQAANGYLYGTTEYGGGTNSNGTVFRISPSGALTKLYSFCTQSGCADGGEPEGTLVQAFNGDLYGTTAIGGGQNGGTVFKITPGGTLTTLYSFCSQTGCADGENPYAGLVQGSDGYLYGTTLDGGPNAGFTGKGAGTVFKITPRGTLTTLYNFCSQAGCTDGELPSAGLIQATDANLYGTTELGGNGAGTIFKITPTGTLTTLHSFDGTDGSQPVAGVFQATNGDFYGTTYYGGANNAGTVFSLAVGLGPFVEARPASGEAEAKVEILGSDLTGATSVTFHGTPATFTVVSSTLITASVPVGATTGRIEVVAPGGTLSSNVAFRIP